MRILDLTKKMEDEMEKTYPGCSTFYADYTTQGDKQIRGRHVTISLLWNQEKGIFPGWLC